VSGPHIGQRVTVTIADPDKRLLDENRTLRQMLRYCLGQIHLHNADTRHITPQGELAAILRLAVLND
jgi:hypothetical protein